MTPEGQLLADVTAFLRSEMKKGRCYYERRLAVGFGYKKGVPDIWFIKDGKHYELELKRLGGHRSTLQIKYEQIFKGLQVEYACVDTFDKFIEFYNK